MLLSARLYISYLSAYLPARVQDCLIISENPATSSHSSLTQLSQSAIKIMTATVTVDSLHPWEALTKIISINESNLT